MFDNALALGEQHGWGAVHLHEIASTAGIALADIQLDFPQKDALAEAWFDRAEEALLAAPETPDWIQRSVRQRLHAALQSAA